MPHFGLVFEVGDSKELYGMWFEGVPHFSSMRFPRQAVLAVPRLLAIASQLPGCGAAAGVTATTLLDTLARTPEIARLNKKLDALEL